MKVAARIYCLVLAQGALEARAAALDGDGGVELFGGWALAGVGRPSRLRGRREGVEGSLQRRVASMDPLGLPGPFLLDVVLPHRSSRGFGRTVRSGSLGRGVALWNGGNPWSSSHRP